MPYLPNTPISVDPGELTKEEREEVACATKIWKRGDVSFFRREFGVMSLLH
jgi:hypothetical protein